LLHIKSNRKDLCFELDQKFHQSIPNACIAQSDDTFGFAYMRTKSNGFSKDLTGFEDGHENPKKIEEGVWYITMIYCVACLLHFRQMTLS
jgi:deferrochelatase/peroxidase EfeB